MGKLTSGCSAHAVHDDKYMYVNILVTCKRKGLTCERKSAPCSYVLKIVSIYKVAPAKQANVHVT